MVENCVSSKCTSLRIGKSKIMFDALKSRFHCGRMFPFCSFRQQSSDRFISSYFMSCFMRSERIIAAGELNAMRIFQVSCFQEEDDFGVPKLYLVRGSSRLHLTDRIMSNQYFSLLYIVYFGVITRRWMVIRVISILYVMAVEFVGNLFFLLSCTRHYCKFCVHCSNQR